MNRTLLQPGASERKTLDRIRVQIEEIAAQIEETAGAPWPHEIILARMVRDLRIQQRNAEYRMKSFTAPGAFAYPEPENYIGFVAWLFGEREFEARLRARIKEMAPDPGLLLDERNAALAKLRAKEPELLEQEEGETCKLESRGFVIDRRRYVDAGLLLRVWEKVL